MILCDEKIVELVVAGDLLVEPFEPELIRAASLCLRLGSEFLTPRTSGTIDVREQNTYPEYRRIRCGDGEGFELPSREFVLARTIEQIRMPRQIAGSLSNLSGLARLGLNVAASTLVSPGFGESGPSTLTLELSNHLDVPIILYPGMRICHIVFCTV